MTSDEEEEEQPVDFVPDRNIWGQPIPKMEVEEYVPPTSKPFFKFTLPLPKDRLLAGLIDLLVLALALHFIDDDWLFTDEIFTSSRAPLYFNLFVGCMYHGFFDSSARQATPGKSLLGLKITNVKGNRISFFQAIGRYLISGISLLALSFGYINIFLSAKGRAWHDIIAGTYVVVDEEKEVNAVKTDRRTGLIIVLILAVANTIVYANMYSEYKDAKTREAEAFLMTQERHGIRKPGESNEKATKVAVNDFLYSDSVHKFKVLVKKNCFYSSTTPPFDFIVAPTDSAPLEIYWVVAKEDVPDSLTYGNYLSNIGKTKDNLIVSDIKLLESNNAFGIEQATVADINRNGDTAYSITRAYLKDKVVFLMSIFNTKKNTRVTANEITKQIFDSFEIIE